MSYHHFINLRELFQGDLNSKLLEYVISKDFKVLFHATTAEIRKIAHTMAMQKFNSHLPRLQHVKTRIQQHVQDTKRLVVSDKKSDSFANHFVKLVPKARNREKGYQELYQDESRDSLERKSSVMHQDFWYQTTQTMFQRGWRTHNFGHSTGLCAPKLHWGPKFYLFILFSLFGIIYQ